MRFSTLVKRSEVEEAVFDIDKTRGLYSISLNFYNFKRDCGVAVVKVLRYKSEGRLFDSSWCHWNFSLI